MENFLRIIKLGYKNFVRNRGLTLGATLLMTQTLMMVSVALIVTLLIRDTVETFRSKIDVAVFFRDDAVTDAKIQDLISRIKTDSNVKSIEFYDKNKALAIFGGLALDESIKKPISQDNNPLPRSVQIKTSNPEQLQAFADNLKTSDTDNIICDSCIHLNKDFVSSFTQVTKSIQQAAIALSIFFGIIAIFNVLNIIQITINARRDEIEIMRYVGASNAFVRGPFIVEGILYGIFSAILTTIFLYFAPMLVTNRPDMQDIFGKFGVNIVSYIPEHLVLLICVQLIIGIVIGASVSIFSVRKFLKA